MKTFPRWVAIGCYINFLEVDKKIFMPPFDNKVEDEIAKVTTY
ncbi:MAG: hypothetical protein ACOYNC_08675 [Bacteroidales bacterium]